MSPAKPFPAVALGMLLSLALLPQPTPAANDFSVAERALFMKNHLADLKPPQTLRYHYRKSGSLEESVDDEVAVMLKAQADGKCCAASVDFFTGPRQRRQPEVDTVEGNPVILYFLEHDIREMERLTKGKANYFRKRIRMSVYQGATVTDAERSYRGRPVRVQEIVISPYTDDPNRARFEKLASKQYRFLLSDAVPGGIYAIRTHIGAEAPGAPALIDEELLLDGAQAAPR